MHKYVWAGVSFFDNELKMGHIEAYDEKEALYLTLGNLGYSYRGDGVDRTVKEIKELAFDIDCLIGVYRVS